MPLISLIYISILRQMQVMHFATLHKSEILELRELEIG